MKTSLIVFVICVTINASKSQLFDKIRKFDTNLGLDQKSSDSYSYQEYNPHRTHQNYHYNNKPIEQVYHQERPIHYHQEYEKFTPVVHQNHKSGSDGHEEHSLIDHKEGANKEFSKLDKHLDKGHNKHGLEKNGGYHDQKNDGKQALEKSKFKADSEYSHDRGHGFVKSWSWDRAHGKKGAEGQSLKKGSSHSASNKGGHGSVAKHGSQAHDQKDIKAVKGESGYKKFIHEEAAKKTNSDDHLDFDHKFPIYG